MEHTEQNRRAAEAYLRDNAALRKAIGVCADVQLRPHYLGAGEHNLNFWFTEPESSRRYVLRVNVVPQPFHESQVAYEHAALEALAPSRCTPTPVYVDNSDTALGKGVLVISFCEGEELDFDALQPGDLRCAAQLMADVHAVPAGSTCLLHRPRDPLRELFDECMQRYEDYHRSAFEDARVTRWANLFISEARKQLDVPFNQADCSHIVNTETLPSHFLIPKAAASQASCATPTRQGGTGRFCADPGAFIDWERPLIGEVAQDLAYFVSPTTTFWDSSFLFPASQVDEFVEDYWRAVDGRFPRGNFDERFPAYRTMTALRSVTWCCKALARCGHDDPRNHMTEKAAKKLPVYLADDFMEMVAATCLPR